MKSKLVGGMGFKVLAVNSDSLLAKQAWRLIHDKTSLFYKVFRARFFPNKTIMEAIDSRMGSYAWRSILKGRVVLQGARWRVGNGESINIWQHHWLPRKHSPLAVFYTVESWENQMVASLINSSTRQWNKDAIDGLIAHEEAKIIKKDSTSKGCCRGCSDFGHFRMMASITVSRDITFSKKSPTKTAPQTRQIMNRSYGGKYGRLASLKKYKNLMCRAC